MFMLQINLKFSCCNFNFWKLIPNKATLPVVVVGAMVVVGVVVPTVVVVATSSVWKVWYYTLIQWRIQGAPLARAPPTGPDSFVLTYKFFET